FTAQLAANMHIYLAVPIRSFARWLAKGTIKGFEKMDADASHKLKAPFKEAVILRMSAKEAIIELPVLGKEFLAMSLGVQYSRKGLKAGRIGAVRLAQATAAPKFDRKRQSYTIEYLPVGGLTVE